ncbi:MAG TPA: MASE1 domain-containing protein [Gemmatimonadaceae bacterium]|nr:MASE1 domain-containing protein [Gemmatimonadaceae bacterium]
MTTSRRLVVMAGLAVLYFVAAKLGLQLAYVNASATAVWAPTGIALAALLLFGYEVWPGVFLGAFAANLLTAGDLATSTYIAIGNSLEGIVGTYLVTRFAGGAKAFERTRDILKFALLAGAVSTVVSPTIGVTALALRGFAAWHAYVAIWSTWWLGDSVGNLVIAPALLIWSANPRIQLTRGHAMKAAEAVALLVCLQCVCLLLFGSFLPRESTHYPLEFLCLPMLLWAAYRFGPRATVTATIVLAGLGLWGTIRGFGPFAGGTPNASLVLLQTFLAFTSVLSLVFASIVSEHRRAEELVRQMAVTDPLTGLVNYRRFMQELESEIARSSRTARTFAILFIDLDHLKQINDSSGHLAGSQAIRRVADALRGSCRHIDTAARIGGDEFAVILPETREATGRELLDRITAGLAVDRGDVRISISAGAAEHPRDGATAEALLSAADALLYAAKAQRRVGRVPTGT